MKNKLTPKQQRFVEEYLLDLNATAAAKRAGYSVKTAEWIGPQLLGKTHVASAVKTAKVARSEQTGITVASVLADILRLQIKAEQAGEFAPAIKAAELLGKHVGAFEQHNKQKNPLASFDAVRFFGELFKKPGEAEPT